MKYILFLVAIGSVSCATTTVTETKPDGTKTETKTTVADPALIGKAIDAAVLAAQLSAEKKQEEVEATK